MKIFWRKRDTSKKEIAIDPPAQKALVGLSLEVDKKGRVVYISQELKSLLAISTAELPLALSAFLTQPFSENSLPVDEWPNQLSLVFLGREGRSLYMQGALFSEPPHWRIVLIDNTSLVMRSAEEELRRKILDFTILKSTQLRASSSRSLENLTEEWLEGLMLRLRLPWISVLTRQTKQWQQYAKVSLPEASSIAGVVEEARDILQGLNPRTSSPIPLVIGIHQTPVVLFPYAEHDGVYLWLMMPASKDKNKLYGLDHADWTVILYLFSSPLHSALSQKNMQRVIERKTYLQKILASGWWEYYPDLNKVCMDANLANILGLVLSHDGSVSFETAMQAIDPLDLPEYRDQLVQTVSAGTKLNMALRIRANGHSTWYRMMAERTEGDGDNRRVFGYAMNINDLKQMETAVDDAWQRLEGLIYNAPAIVYILDYQDETFQLSFCSASLESMLGWTYEQLQAMPLGALVHPDDSEEYYKGLKELLRIGSISRRYRVRDSKNIYHWILDESKLLRDERGLPKEVVGLSIDVTDATESAELVRKSEERYRMLVEDAPAIICRYLPDLTVLHSNRQLLTSLGLNPDVDRDLKINLGDFLSPAQRQKLLQRYAQLTPESPSGSIEMLLNLSENVHVWWVWSDRALFDEDGNLVEIQGVGRDNTEVHNARQQIYQSSKMATLGEMATGLAHEISQPLTVMHMALTNILKRLDSSEAIDPKYLLDKLKRLESQVSRVSKVVDHMRLFGRHSEIEGTLFDPTAAIQGAVLLVQEGMEKDSVRVTMDLLPLPQIKGHVDRFEQVLINLLLNAQYASTRYFNEAGRPAWIHIYSKVENDMVCITVEDSGGGIPDDLLDRIFEPFVTTKPVGKGTGLGLSVSYGIINLMRGKLTAESGLYGARFTISVPVAHDES